MMLPFISCRALLQRSVQEFLLFAGNFQAVGGRNPAIDPAGANTGRAAHTTKYAKHVNYVNPILGIPWPIRGGECLWAGCLRDLAGGLGFEPRLAESESAVLPLDDPPPARRRRDRSRKTINARHDLANAPNEPRPRLRPATPAPAREWRRTYQGLVRALQRSRSQRSLPVSENRPCRKSHRRSGTSSRNSCQNGLDRASDESGDSDCRRRRIVTGRNGSSSTNGQRTDGTSLGVPISLATVRNRSRTP